MIIKKEYYSVEELLADVGWNGLIDSAKKGEFGKWLEEHGFEYENHLLKQYFQRENFTDIDLIIQICDLFDIKKNTLTLDAIKEISQALANERRKFDYISILGIKEYEVVENQAELIKITKTPNNIYLCNEDFKLPLGWNHRNYIGTGAAVVTLPNRENINFADYDISLKNIMIYRLHNICIAADNLENVNILPYEENEEKNLYLFYNLSLGRNSFETQRDFCRRVKDLLPVKVGTVFLYEDNYHIEEQKFYIQINWDMPFIDYAAKVGLDRSMWFMADVKMAEDVYLTQRKFAVYAVFNTDGNKIFISKLHIHFSKYGFIEVLLSDLPKAEKIHSGSGFGGYGLELIDAR
ncbi:hypothetical protein [Megasphaera stantonii]|uniref:Uncharacterized protein n=1 Tax=Megasphaera stantonii TaxID=2144175 RepID=A0A346AY05_9FIRM|nr:hypothetical protein [Megasphaera stantonii]AXL20748.1 hypothetical protein DKB62_03730 [Megasphaera stantonii]